MFNFSVTGEIWQPQVLACDQLHFVPFYDKLEKGVEKTRGLFTKGYHTGWDSKTAA
jgi:hypothetical protein